MIYKTNITFAFRGHAWGFYDINNINLFQLRSPRPFKVPWRGRKAIFLKLKKDKNFMIKLPCIRCNTYHTFRIDHHELLNSKTKVLECPVTEFKLCFFGERDKVLCIAKNHSEGHCLASREKDNGFFVNPQVMYEVAKKVYSILYDSGIECECGSNLINIHLYTDRIELVCSYCRGINIIYAENNNDLKVIERVTKISLKEKGFRCLDALYGKGS